MRFALFILFFISACGQRTSFAKDNASCSNVKLQVLGSGGPEITDGLASSSYLIWIDGKAKIMLDAGGGSSLNFEKSGASFNDLEAILFTHLHVDHSAALPVYIKAGYFSNRTKRLPIFGPDEDDNFPSTEDFVAALFSDQQKSAYPYLSDNYRKQPSSDFLVDAITVRPNGKIWLRQLTNKILLESSNVIHAGIPAIAWRVNVGGCSITFSGDMNGESGHLEKLARATHLLVANNAVPEQAHPIAKRLHMTPSIIAKIASLAKPKRILLSHFMLRTIDKKQQTVNIIKRQYAGTVLLANDLDLVSLE